MGRVIFMCGPAGSGKSTVAREYEQQGMARLSFDQEAWSRGITTMPLPKDVHRDIEHVLRARLVDLVQAGSDVVLDFSFWSRQMRDEYRELLRPCRDGGGELFFVAAISTSSAAIVASRSASSSFRDSDSSEPDVINKLRTRTPQLWRIRWPIMDGGLASCRLFEQLPASGMTALRVRRFKC